MLVILFILLFLIAAGIAIEDFRSRMISWYWIPAIFIVLLADGVIRKSWSEVLFNLGFNSTLLTIQFLALTLYFSVKNRRWVNLLKHYFGLGDALLLLAICSAFAPLHFTLFLLVSCMVTIVGHLMNRSGQQRLIPFAAYLGMVLVLVKAIDLIGSGWSPLNDDHLFQLLTLL